MANALKVIREQLPRWWREQRDLGDQMGSVSLPDVAESFFPQTPSDVALMAAGGPFSAPVRAAALGLAGASYAPDTEAAGGAVKSAGKVVKKVGNALSKNKKNIARVEIPKLVPGSEDDMIRSLQSDVRLKGGGTIPRGEVEQALANRMRYQAEPQTLPKKPEEMSDQDWLDFGKQYGADFSQNPMQSLGVSDIRTRREAMLPGGLEGKFTIPDLFRIKGQNFDPSILPQETHNALMKKFIRTYDRGGEQDPVDVFNDLNFALLSPNAPLTQNEFLAQRLRIRNPEELRSLAQREGTPDLANMVDVESGVGAASRGGMGVKGTADLSNQATLARLLIDKPEMFRPQGDETLRDVGFRVMNQVPGLSVKTASLGVPWTNLNKANTSAVDLWMIRKNYEKLAQENPRFAQRMADLRSVNPGLSEEEAAIKIIGGGHPSAVYRTKGGELHPDLPSYLQPDKLAYEPGKFTRPNEFYTDIMSMVDRSRGANPEIELFPEQWRLWDTYRGRVEPHEMAHPDWRKIPRQSFTENRNALAAHREAGYMNAPDSPVQPTNTEADWRKLYYGFITPKQAATLAGVAGAGAYAVNSLMRPKEKAETEIKKRPSRIDAAVDQATNQ
jgi:hypothetical protein